MSDLTLVGVLVRATTLRSPDSRCNGALPVLSKPQSRSPSTVSSRMYVSHPTRLRLGNTVYNTSHDLPGASSNKYGNTSATGSKTQHLHLHPHLLVPADMSPLGFEVPGRSPSLLTAAVSKIRQVAGQSQRRLRTRYLHLGTEHIVLRVTVVPPLDNGTVPSISRSPSAERRIAD
ncbi:hypothetical protein B0I37DRAFT_225087 [Chaetomium sp. MPI-CAGE-AT-0009]|nr:hypothetical protein B0I37DRAFT_225087 [Chaetomium sp. MPI-CAGE-AT-0009]